MVNLDAYVQAQQLAAAQARIRALERYADHLAWCQHNQYLDDPCNCGWAAVEARLGRTIG